MIQTSPVLTLAGGVLTVLLLSSCGTSPTGQSEPRVVLPADSVIIDAPGEDQPGEGSRSTPVGGPPPKPGNFTRRIRLLGTKPTAAGPIVIDGGRFTLYRFDGDKPSPASPSCTGRCAMTWPPALVDELPGLFGISSDLIGTVARSDGSRQLTMDGQPLYRFSKDTAGASAGHGKGNAWWAVTPTGLRAAEI